MLSAASNQSYGQAVLDSVQNGSFPESEEIISAELPTAAIPGILKLLEQARNAVKTDIQSISQDNAQDTDGWVRQAKQLRYDIELSHDESGRIVYGATELSNLRSQADDGLSKVSLLNGEIAFTQLVVSVFKRIRKLQHLLASLQDAIIEDREIEISGILVESESELEDLRDRYTMHATAILKERLKTIRAEIEQRLLRDWNFFLQIDASSATFKVQHQIHGRSGVTLDAIANALGEVGLLDGAVTTLCKDIEKYILLPRLQWQSDRRSGCLSFDEDELKYKGELPSSSTQRLIDDLSDLIAFLERRLPQSVLSRVSQILMPSLIIESISSWLSCVIPTDLEAMTSFQATIRLVIRFGDFLNEHHWPGSSELNAWVNDIPRIWLNKRRGSALDGIRSLLADGPTGVEKVERVETQLVSLEENVFASGGIEEDWNAEWSDDEHPTKQLSASADMKSSNEEREAEDVTAWGLDEINDGEVQPTKSNDIGEQEPDAWGWGEEDEAQDPSQSAKKEISNYTERQSNGYSQPLPDKQRHITLRETYGITALPKEILKIIAEVITDAESMMNFKHNGSPIALAATGLYDLPRLMLTMYRASAPISYSSHPSSNMFIYNDGLWLTENLHVLGQKYSRTPLGFSAEINALSAFSKRAYGKEMESQRTILSDLLDGAQGFSRCTEVPYAQACDVAIASAIGRLHELHRQWTPVLSNSALLQSLGSLLSTLINKLIVDVEDLSDISEPESQRLTSFCSRVSSLEDLFLPREQSHGQETVVPLTAVYTPGWLKFQYLANILESSLVDIKFLWEQGELSLEYDSGELIELIEALFVDSEHRRRAISEMRR